MEYKKKGQVAENVSVIITLIIGVGVAALVIIFVGTLGGQVYNQVDDKLCDFNTGGIGDAGCTDGLKDYNIASSITKSINSGFDALETTADYLPIIVLAVIIFIVLGLVVGMGGGLGGGNQYRGTAL
jgi:Na+-driven multidrug efflux pump